jgi:hypothetical protein
MSSGIRIVLLVLGIILFAIIFELVRRERFREELSIMWFAVSIVLMASSVFDLIINPISRKLHVGYPPALAFAWIIFFLIIALLYFSIVISDLKSKIKELSQKIALMDLEIAGRRTKDPRNNL